MFRRLRNLLELSNYRVIEKKIVDARGKEFVLENDAPQKKKLATIVQDNPLDVFESV